MATPDGQSAAEELVGLTLTGGWTVVKRLQPSGSATGGTFSIQYLVVNGDGHEAFLKALDLREAFYSEDPAYELQLLVNAFNFERDLLTKCHGLSRVITAIDHGVVRVPGHAQRVNYIIFELAEGDIRRALDVSEGFGDAAKLRALHHVATGLRQLHQNLIAHQDLKPSNIFVLPSLLHQPKITKVGDLGRAHDRSRPGPHDDFEIAGDYQYAPPEQLFGDTPSSYEERRVACDLYQLGSLASFLFCGVSMNGLLGLALSDQQIWRNWGDSYTEALPYVRDAFGRALRRVREAAPGDLSSEIEGLVGGLCEPDPKLRGFPTSRRGTSSQYNLQRTIACLDLMSRRTQAGVIRRNQ